MKIVAFLSSTILATGLNAAEFSVPSQVSDVVMYTSGGLITRDGDLDVPAGVHELRFTLPQSLDDRGSVDVLLPEGAPLSVIASSFRTERLEPKTTEKTPQEIEREAALSSAEAALGEFSIRESGAEAALNSADYRLRMLNAVATGSAQNAETLPSAEQLSSLVATLGAEVETAIADRTAARNVVDGLAKERAELEKAVDDARQALDAVRPTNFPYLELVLSVSADAAFSGPVGLRYVDYNMSWQPSYELLVEQEASTGSLQIKRKANVRQGTGEDWSNVSVTLSTANFTGQTQTQLPRSQIRRLVEKEELQSRVRTQSLAKASGEFLADEARVIVAEEAAPETQIQIKGQTLEFALPQPVSLRNDFNGATIFALDEKSVETKYFAKANARRDEKAFLYTELDNDTGGTLLPGQAKIFREGALIGEVFMPMIPNGDSEEIALGPVDGILIDRRVIRREDGDKGIITTSNSRMERYETRITSLLPYDFDLLLFDSIPVSEAEDLVIKEVLQPKPDARNIDGNRGVLRWDINLKVGQETAIQSGFDMTWPSDKIIR